MSILKIIKKSGVVELENLYSENLITEWNSKLDKIIKAKNSKNDKRVEIDLNELVECGIVDQIFNDKFKSVISNLMDDPVLYLMNANEIVGNEDKPHVANNSLNGWHYDISTLSYLDRNNPNFITMFIYLSDVLNFDDAPFEICSETNLDLISNITPTKKILGKKGKCFVWNNSFIHRASPNKGPNKRRIIKIGFKNNYFQNDFIPKLNSSYSKIKYKDNFTDFAFGKHHFSTEKSKKLSNIYKAVFSYSDFIYNSKLELNFKLRFIKLLKKIFKSEKKN